MDQKKWRAKQAYQFATHEAVPPERIDEELKRESDLRHKHREFKERLLETELEKRPGLLDDLNNIRTRQGGGAGLKVIDYGELRDKHRLNRGWLLWLDNYLRTGESDPQRLILGRDYVRDGAINSERYFPLSNTERERFERETALLEFEHLGFYEWEYSKAGRGADAIYDEAFQKIESGEMSQKEAYGWFLEQAKISRPDKGTRDRFNSAMRRRRKKAE
jgi:hypothetical protein